MRRRREAEAWHSSTLAALPEAKRRAYLASLSDEEALHLAYDWRFWARPNQVAPEGDWTNWLLLAGRGFGKTRAGAEWVREQVEHHGKRAIAMVAPTARDTRRIMVEGPSGLLNICPPWSMPVYHSSKGELAWPNGAKAYLYSAEEPERLRGPEHDAAWCDELCLVAGTLITCLDVEKPIENVRPGDRVWTRKGWRRVRKAAVARRVKPLWRLETACGRAITGSAEHPVFISSSGFVPMSQVSVGQSACVLITSNGTAKRASRSKLSVSDAARPFLRQGFAPNTASRTAGRGITKPRAGWFTTPSKVISVSQTGTMATVYNLEVDGEHEYFANGILTHNCAWQYREDTWDMLQFTLRAGDNPRVVITTTPKPFELLATLMKDQEAALTRGTTYDNRANLAPKFFDAIIRRYEGTRLGRQELNAEVLEDMPGALWTRGMIEARRIRATRNGDIREAARLKLRRVVVAVDPSGSDSETGAQQGIVVVGEGYDGRFYVLRDASCSESPDKWGKVAVELYHEEKADLIVAERNFGGDMVRFVIQAQDKNVPVKLVTASNGKHIRAEPIAALYEQGRVSHVGAFAALEDQMCLMTHEGYQGGGSPDRLDALVWGLTELAYPGRRPGFVQGVRY